MNISTLNTRSNSTRIAILIAAVFFGLILYTQLSDRPTGYSQKMEQIRAQKDMQFENDPNSPIPRTDKDSFQGLNYFVIQEAYAVPAKLIPDQQADTLTLMTSKGSDYQEIEAGKLQFSLQGGTYALTAYKYLEEEKKNALFIPFSDLTSGFSTYGGGRYLDIPTDVDLMIDFNQAYNPYCVYSVDFVCPLPPRENDLPLEIRAGELNYP